MKNFLSLCILIMLLVLTSSQTWAEECVVLLHGLARTDDSMEEMEEGLLDAGFRVINHDYPSREYSIEQLSSAVIRDATSGCPAGEKVHFVAHSLGGILIRYFLENHELSDLGRVVMLGPPNKGSEVVDAFAEVPVFEMFNGPAAMQLGTEQTSIPNRLGAADFEVGIIAGTWSINQRFTREPAITDGSRFATTMSHDPGMPLAIELAAATGLSPYHFIRIFRRQVGLTPHAYLTQVRVQRAQQLLEAHGSFEIATPAQLGVVTFRYRPPDGGEHGGGAAGGRGEGQAVCPAQLAGDHSPADGRLLRSGLGYRTPGPRRAL